MGSFFDPVEASAGPSGQDLLLVDVAAEQLVDHLPDRGGPVDPAAVLGVGVVEIGLGDPPVPVLLPGVAQARSALGASAGVSWCRANPTIASDTLIWA